MIADIRGTHGSGKTWLVQELLRRYGGPLLADLSQGGDEIPTIGHHLGPPLNGFVIGRYDLKLGACGGCDQIKSADEVCRRVRLLAPLDKPVVMEGILVAHTFQRYNDLAVEMWDLHKIPYTFFFMDTPLDVCIERVKYRRSLKGNSKPFNPANVIKDWYNIWETVRGKLVAAGRTVVVLNHKNPIPSLLWHLRQ
jgi:hypothetical protein